MSGELIAAIDSLRAERGRVVVAICGFGGSGKTTLANSLRDHYRLRERQVVHLDDFIVDRARGEGLLGGFDWGRLRDVLEDIRAGRRLSYRGTDFDGRPQAQRVEEELPEVVIVEGIRLLRPELSPYFDLQVWIDCPLELAAKRGRERDRADGADEAHLAVWDAEWIPKDAEYFATYRPDRLADLVLRD